MYRVSPTGKVEGVLNDYDLASWDKFPTTNSDQVGTFPFTTLDLLRGGFERGIPRLYRHDAESFVWVLTYLTAITVEYKGRSVKISRPSYFDPWFYNAFESHRNSKQSLYIGYGRTFPIPEHYAQYITIVRKLIVYWVGFDGRLMDLENDGSVESEIDDPKGTLESLVQGMEKALGADAEAQEGFTKVKNLLLEAIETPKAA